MTNSMPSAGGIARPEFIALIASLMAINALAIDIMLPALPYMGEALSITNENDRQLVLSSYMFGFGLTQLVFGPLSDRYGRRAPLLVGLSIYVIAALAAIIAPSFTVLLAMRFVQGMGAASTRVISQSIVRDVFAGRAMAEVMSLVFMVFMIIPIIAPAIGQIFLFSGPWTTIFLFMGLLGAGVTAWTFWRLPETLTPEHRRTLSLKTVIEGFGVVFSNRAAISYALAGVFIFGALFGFMNASQQIYVDIYGLGPWFPVALGFVASLMAVSSYINSRMVARIGMRRLSHFAILVILGMSSIWWLTSLFGTIPLPLFFIFIGSVMLMFGWSASNMNALSMEPLGKVAGTAAAVFGFVQTIGGALLGLLIGRAFDGSSTPIAGGFALAGFGALIFILIAEKGRLFGVGQSYDPTQPEGMVH